jgi:hypothetical protein
MTGRYINIINDSSAILFGIRKQNQAERGKEDLFAKLDRLKQVKEDLLNRVRKKFILINY